MLRPVLGVLTLVGAWVAYTQTQPPAPEPLKIEKLKDDLYVIQMARGVSGGNVAVYLTDEGVILRLH